VTQVLITEIHKGTPKSVPRPVRRSLARFAAEGSAAHGVKRDHSTTVRMTDVLPRRDAEKLEEILTSSPEWCCYRKFGHRLDLCPVSGVMRPPLLLMLGFLPACLQLGAQRDSVAGADNGGTFGVGGAGGAGTLGGARATGTQCGVDPSSGVSLCLGISSCAALRVDPDQFPDCGFRTLGTQIDLECLCGDSLCPMGPAASCIDAKRLLAEQSAQGVCAGVAEDRCVRVKQTPVTSKASCDPACRAECSGVPGCVTLCGC
jgi:hypothetical protein